MSSFLPRAQGTGEIVSLYELFIEIWRNTTKVLLLEKKWVNEYILIQRIQISINQNIMLR